MILLWAIFIAFATLGLCVIVHYEALRLTSLLIPRLTISPRPKVLVAITIVFLAHLLEIIVFAIIYRLMQPFPQLGEIAGHFSQSAIDYFYFSITSFTTLGIGDLFPHGAYRIVVGVESLTGFVLIGWSVSFTYLVMQECWTQHISEAKLMAEINVQ